MMPKIIQIAVVPGPQGMIRDRIYTLTEDGELHCIFANDKGVTRMSLPPELMPDSPSFGLNPRDFGPSGEELAS